MAIRNRKAVTFSAGVVVLFALAAVGLSQPGRQSVSRLLSVLTGAKTDYVTQSSTGAYPIPANSVAQRAYTHHGWSPAVLDCIEKGSVTWYDQTGAVTRQGTLAVYRKFPNLLRVEITGSTPSVIGFDGNNPWQAGQSSLNATAVRDVEQWIRYSPERLFTAFGLGAAYRESGRYVEDHIPPTPWQGAVDLDQPREYDQAEMIDLIGPSTQVKGAPNQRRVTYLVDRQTSLIYSARWLEPADPSQSAMTRSTSLIATRVDFGLWRNVSGVQWPYQITHWSGGKVDFQVNLTSVQLNQNPAATLFQHP